jgi:hypothetical protein
MSRRSRLTFARAVALLILGVGLGVTIFVSHHLRPEALELRVKAALRGVFATEPQCGLVIVGLDTGVEIRDLRIDYPGDRDPAAVEIESVLLKVDHRDLLAGKVTIRQVDLRGVTLRLKAGPDVGGTPSMPGVFAGTGLQGFEVPPQLPDIHIHPGAEKPSRVEILHARQLAPGEVLALDVLSATIAADGPLCRLRAELKGTRVADVELVMQYDRNTREIAVDLDAKALRWQRNDVALLAKPLRDGLPPVELGGEADVKVKAVIGLPMNLDWILVDATLRDIQGVFGNLHTGQRVGLPFWVRGGSGTLGYRLVAEGVRPPPELASAVPGVQHVALRGFKASYVSPAGVEGRIEAGTEIAFERAGLHLDLSLRGRDLAGDTQDLRHLLPPDIVEAIVEKFLPAGRFDFDLTVSQRPGTEEKVLASLIMREGRFDYAGRLDELTGKRFGFRYPLERCRGSFRIETHVPTARGYAEVIEIERLEGYNPVARPQTGGPEDVAAQVQGKAVIYDAEDREDLDIRIDVRDLPIDGKLARAFASTPGGTPYRGFDLSGWASRVKIRIERDAFAEAAARATYDVTLHDCSIAYEGFPYPIRKVAGRIVSSDLTADEQGRQRRVLRFEGLRGEAPQGGEVRARGEVHQNDLGEADVVDLSIVADRVTIGPDLERALLSSRAASTGVTELWRSLRPYGYLSADVALSGPQQVEVRVDLSALALRGYQDIDCPITHLGGHVSYERGVLKLDHVSGRILDAPFHVSGEFHEDGVFEVTGAADRLVLEKAVQRILEALAPPAARAVQALRLESQSSFDLRLTCTRAAADAPVDLVFAVDDLDVKSALMDFDLQIQGGPVELALDRITARNLHLRAAEGQIRLEEVVVPLDERAPAWGVIDARNLDPAVHLEPLFGKGIRGALGANARIDLTGFRAEYLRAERQLILSGALDLRRNLRTEGVELEPTGQVGFSPVTLTLPRVEGDPLRFAGVIEFRQLNCNVPIAVHDVGGELHVADGTLAPDFTIDGALRNARMTLFDRELTGMALNFSYRPDYLHLGNIDGEAYGGDFEGDAEVYLLPPRAFKVRFQARHVQIGELLKEDLPRSDPMSGVVEARFEFESPSGEVRDMRGRGQVRVADGSLFRVPGLRPILAVLSRVTPLDDEPRFSRAEADFTVMGEEIRLHHCRLSTSLNDVDAEGSISIYGDLDLVVEPKVTRLLDLPRLINIPVLSTLRDLWHRIAYEIRLEGTLDSPTIRLRGLPFLKRSRRPYTQSPHAAHPERVRPRILP